MLSTCLYPTLTLKFKQHIQRVFASYNYRMKSTNWIIQDHGCSFATNMTVMNMYTLDGVKVPCKLFYNESDYILPPLFKK